MEIGMKLTSSAKNYFDKKPEIVVETYSAKVIRDLLRASDAAGLRNALGRELNAALVKIKSLNDKVPQEFQAKAERKNLIVKTITTVASYFVAACNRGEIVGVAKGDSVFGKMFLPVLAALWEFYLPENEKQPVEVKGGADGLFLVETAATNTGSIILTFSFDEYKNEKNSHQPMLTISGPTSFENVQNQQTITITNERQIAVVDPQTLLVDQQRNQQLHIQRKIAQELMQKGQQPTRKEHARKSEPSLRRHEQQEESVPERKEKKKQLRPIEIVRLPGDLERCQSELPKREERRKELHEQRVQANVAPQTVTEKQPLSLEQQPLTQPLNVQGQVQQQPVDFSSSRKLSSDPQRMQRHQRSSSSTQSYLPSDASPHSLPRTSSLSEEKSPQKNSLIQQPVISVRSTQSSGYPLNFPQGALPTQPNSQPGYSPSNSGPNQAGQQHNNGRKF